MLIQANPQTGAGACAASDTHGGPPSVSPQPDRRPTDVSEKTLRVALLTPWDQQCGNAEYAKRLAAGLRQFAAVEPVELINFSDTDEEYPRRHRRRVCLNVARTANKTAADLVHIQHEFCFFGRRVREANRNFRRLVRRLRKPVVITLHTWPAGMNRRRRKHWWQNIAEAVRFSLAKRQLAPALRRAAALVIHSHETYQKLLATYPRLKRKTFVIPIPVEPIDHRAAVPPVRKRPGEKWVVLPGFVSRYKGHSHAIAALPLLPESYRLVIAGGVHPKDKSGPEYWMQLLAEADAAGLQNRVIFTGYLSDPQQQAAVLHQADCFLLPYDEVGQSGSAVLADALSHDRPVITSHAKSMFVYRGLPNTVFSSIAVDVTCPETLAGIIARSLGDDLPGIPLSRRQQQAVRDHFSLAQTKDRYQEAYAFALRGANQR